MTEASAVVSGNAGWDAFIRSRIVTSIALPKFGSKSQYSEVLENKWLKYLKIKEWRGDGTWYVPTSIWWEENKRRVACKLHKCYIFYSNVYGKPVSKDYVVGSSNFTDIIAMLAIMSVSIV